MLIKPASVLRKASGLHKTWPRSASHGQWRRSGVAATVHQRNRMLLLLLPMWVQLASIKLACKPGPTNYAWCQQQLLCAASSAHKLVMLLICLHQQHSRPHSTLRSQDKSCPVHKPIESLHYPWGCVNCTHQGACIYPWGRISCTQHCCSWSQQASKQLQHPMHRT